MHNNCCPFPFEDLATVPANKYYKLIGGMDPIYQAWYSPSYTFPAGVRTMVREWSVCDEMVLGAVKPRYVAVPTEEWRERNEEWTWTPPMRTGTAGEIVR